jgi:hypothetical protein
MRKLLITTSAAFLISAVPVLADDLYSRGVQDRMAWEAWFNSLIGDMRAGAEYWAGQRSKPVPGNCLGTPDFTSGCNQAKIRLTNPDTLRKSQPDYKLGWNLGPPVPGILTPPSSTPPSWQNQDEVARRDEATARATEARNARVAAENEQREIAARAAKTEADRIKAENERKRAENEALAQRAEAKLRYQEMMASEIKKEQERGYKPITFDDYLLDKRDLAASKAKISIHGFYRAAGKSEYLLKTPSSDATDDDSRISLLTEDAERDTRKYFLMCRDSVGICSINLLGTVTACTRTDRFGAKTDLLCFKVDDSWNVPEPPTS